MSDGKPRGSRLGRGGRRTVTRKREAVVTSVLKYFRAAYRRTLRVARLISSPLANLVYWVEYRASTPLLPSGEAGIGSSSNSRMPIDLSVIICVVAGPNDDLGIRDLLNSARCYLGSSYRVIVTDDSGGLRIARVTREFKEVDYLRNWKLRGIKGLDNSLRRAFSYALQNYRFDAVLRIDADALITGHGLIEDIIGYLKTHPEAGMLGSYRETCTGAIRDFRPIAQQFDKNPEYWRSLLQKATQYGYVLGEHAQGGAYVVSYNCLQAMASAGLLAPRRGRTTFVSEDGIFSLYVRALGYEIHDFARTGPFAIAWRGLPLSPEEITTQGKKVVHSVKYSKDDLRIRDYFREFRVRAGYWEHAAAVEAGSTSETGTHVQGGHG